LHLGLNEYGIVIFCTTIFDDYDIGRRCLIGSNVFAQAFNHYLLHICLVYFIFLVEQILRVKS
jgi:hypothetical protein